VVTWIPNDRCDPEVLLLFILQVKQPQHAHVFVWQSLVHIFLDATLPLQRLFVELLLHELVKVKKRVIFEYNLFLTLKILINNPVHDLEWF